MFCRTTDKHPIAGPPPAQVVYIDDPDEEFQQQLAAANYRAQQQLLNDREWLDDGGEGVDIQVAEFSPTFMMTARLALLILALILLFSWYIAGAHRMSNQHNESPPPAAAPASRGEAHGKTLQAAIQRFANAILKVGTHPDTGMFFFDAQELTVNEKLETLKVRALVDTLCAAGVIERHRFENRLEELVTQVAQQLEDGAKKIAFTALQGGNGRRQQ